VVLASQSNQNNARVLSYTLDANGHLSAPKAIDSSVSAPIVDIAAFSNQLFLLLSDGEVGSLPLASGKQPLVPLVVQSPITQPLSMKREDYTTGDPVPVVPQISGNQKGGTPLLTPLSVSSASSMSAGQVNGVPHLYIGDLAYHRVLDFAEPVVGGTANPIPTTVGTNGVRSSMTFQLNQQYVSSSDLSQVKSLAVDSQNQQLDILSQNELVTIPLAQQTANMVQPTTCSS
jgi:hypothetical protein